MQTSPGCGGDHVRAAALLAGGIARSDRGHLGGAAAVLRDGLSALGTNESAPGPDCTAEHDRLQARMLLTLGFSVHELGDTAAGMRMLELAERVSARHGPGALTVISRAQQGVMLLREGRLAEALEALDRAVELIDQAPAEDQVKLLINRGEVHRQSGTLSPATTDYARAYAIATEAGLDELAFAARHNLGYAHYLSGDLPRALEVMATVEEADSDHYKGIVGLDRARVLLSAGLLADADATLAAAADALARTDLVPMLAEAELARAEAALLDDDVDRARALADRALARVAPRDNRRTTASAELTVLRIAAAADPADPAVEATAVELGDRLGGLGLDHQARLARLIALETRLAGSDPVDPRDLRLTPGLPMDVRLRARLARGTLGLRQGSPARARSEARAGLTELADYQAQFGSLDLQTAAAAHGMKLAAMAVEQELRQNRPTAVLGWLERARAISGRVPEVQPPEDPVGAELLTRLRWVLNELETGGPDADPTGALRRQRGELQSLIRSRSWTVRGTTGAAAVPSITDLRQRLGDATLIALFRLHDRVHAVVLTRRRARLHDLGDGARLDALTGRIGADLDALAMAHIPESLRAAASRSLRSSLQVLDDLLIAPLDLPCAPAVLLPPGRLAALAWGALPQPAGTAAGPGPVRGGLAALRIGAVGAERPGRGRRRSGAAPGHGRGAGGGRVLVAVPAAGRGRRHRGRHAGRGRRRRSGPPRRARQAPTGQPAVLLDPAVRRTGQRLRPRPGPSGPAPGGAVGLRPGSCHGPPRRRDPRADPVAAAQRHGDRRLLRVQGLRRRGGRVDGRLPPAVGCRRGTRVRVGRGPRRDRRTAAVRVFRSRLVATIRGLG